MVDYQRVVDDIRSFLQSSDQSLSDRLKQLAADYAEACEEVNQRLRRCEDFLQKGLRSEAVHFAQAEPVLLDVLAVLDFPERSQWEQVLITYQLPPPVRMRMDTAEALNRAYTEEQPLQVHLKQHRLLALARAPIVERLAVMRQIAELDAANPVWAEDIAEFEKVRHQQLATECDQALVANDPERLFHLHDELSQTRWVNAPPEPLVRRIDERVAGLMHLRKRQALENLAVQLAGAHAVFDEGRARALRDQWNQQCQQSPLVPEDPIFRRAAAPLQWLVQQDQKQARDLAFQTALGELENALNADTPELRLGELFDAVRKFKRPLPARVKERYEQRIGQLQGRRRRREHIILAGVLALGLGMLALLVALIRLR